MIKRAAGYFTGSKKTVDDIAAGIQDLALFSDPDAAERKRDAACHGKGVVWWGIEPLCPVGLDRCYSNGGFAVSFRRIERNVVHRAVKIIDCFDHVFPVKAGQLLCQRFDGIGGDMRAAVVLQRSNGLVLLSKI